MMLKRLCAACLVFAFCLLSVPLRPQPPQQTKTGVAGQAPAETPGAPKGTMLLTIFL
jgi:hypothetical protein